MAARTAAAVEGKPLQPAALQRKISLFLEAAELMLGDLPEVVAEWPRLSDGERASWSLDWSQVAFDDLPFLAEQERAGRLAPPQCERFRALRRHLQEAAPLIERAGLLAPQIPPEDDSPPERQRAGAAAPSAPATRGGATPAGNRAAGSGQRSGDEPGRERYP